MTQPFDFAIATDCPYDLDFVHTLEKAAQQVGLSSYIVMPYNFKETMNKIEHGDLRFNFLYDRASDTSPEFLKLYHFMLQKNLSVLDTIENMNRAADKATMHLEFIANGLNTPYTIIIPPFSEEKDIFLSVTDLAKLGRPFIIKPANTTGGGTGVVDGAESLQDVLKTRREYHHDKYLLQEKVMPFQKDGRRFWFRGFYACGIVECTWWNDLTHVYDRLIKDQIETHQLAPLFSIVQKIASICNLNFFSTEIALKHSGEFIVNDYVNEICDMRLKSRHFDGVPDEIVEKIAESIAVHVKERLKIS